MEIGRVLQSGGVLAILWNETSEELPSPLPAAYRWRLDELQSDTPPPPADPQDFISRGPFGDVRSAEVVHEQVSDREGVLAFAASVSWVASREDRERVLVELAELLPPGDYRLPPPRLPQRSRRPRTTTDSARLAHALNSWPRR